MHPKRILAVAAAAALCACGGPDLEHPGVRLGELPSSALTVCAGGTTLKGVDVSHYDGTIDWTQVAGSGRAFGIAKATEGVTFKDPMFATYWPAIKQAGMVRGAYHFYRPKDSGKQQADFFLDTVGSFAAGDLPPVLDWEVTDSVSNSIDVAEMQHFVDEVKSRTGLTTIVYTSANFLNTIGNPTQFGGLPLWDANWGVACPNLPSAWSTWAFWQTGSSTTIPGTSSTVDLNLFNGTRAQLDAMTGPGTTTPPVDAGTPDAGVDAGTPDAGAADAGADAGTPDAGDSDAGVDAGTPDAGSDAGTPDAGTAGSPDAGSDAGVTVSPPAAAATGCGSAPGAQGAAFEIALVLLAAARRRRAA